MQQTICLLFFCSDWIVWDLRLFRCKEAVCLLVTLQMILVDPLEVENATDGCDVQHTFFVCWEVKGSWLQGKGVFTDNERG